MKLNEAILSRYRFLWHVLIWVWIYCLDVFIFGVGYKSLDRFVLYAILEMPGQLFFAYITVYWILPKYIERLRFVEAVVTLAAAFFITGLIVHILFTLNGIYPNADEKFFWNFPIIFLRAFYCVLKACIFIVFKLLIVWSKTQKRVSEMEKNQVESELKMLKDQVNPHFMFNTLNNLYGLIEKNPLRARESVLGLSGILHYMLYESNQPVVQIDREIKCIRDYIELEKLRYADSLSVAINIHYSLRDLSIVPLCLFPFVENSFKHGASESVKEAWINIDFSVFRGNFIFKIENSKSVLTVKRLNGNGIGLANVKRRLELLYGKDHDLQIIDSEERYLVVLKISLSRMTDQKVKEDEVELSYH